MTTSVTVAGFVTDATDVSVKYAPNFKVIVPAAAETAAKIAGPAVAVISTGVDIYGFANNQESVGEFIANTTATGVAVIAGFTLGAEAGLGVDAAYQAGKALYSLPPSGPTPDPNNPFDFGSQMVLP